MMDGYFMTFAALIYYFLILILPIVNYCKIDSVFRVVCRAYLIDFKLRSAVSNKLTGLMRLKLVCYLFYVLSVSICYGYACLPAYPREFVDQVVKYLLSLRLYYCFEIITVLNRLQLYFLKRVGEEDSFKNAADIFQYNRDVSDAFGPHCLLVVVGFCIYLFVTVYVMLIGAFDRVNNSVVISVLAVLSLCQCLFMFGKQSSDTRTEV